MKKLFLYPLMLCIALCFSGCKDKDSCKDCIGCCSYNSFSPALELIDEIELDLDEDGKIDILIKQDSLAVTIKGMNSNVSVLTGYQPYTMPFVVFTERVPIGESESWHSSFTSFYYQGIYNLGEYFGVRIMHGDCSYYGWVKVGFELPYFSDFKVYEMYFYKGLTKVYAGMKNYECN